MKINIGAQNMCSVTAIVLGLFLPQLLRGQEEKVLFKVKPRGESDWAYFLPYVPERTEYNLELGSMWERQTLYWLAGNLARHVGRCVASSSQSCQQYIELVAGFAGRASNTTFLALVGPRWQWVNLPSAIAPSLQLFVGGVNIRDEEEERTDFTGGIGYSLLTSVHERVDLKFQMRVGWAEQVWSQGMLTVSLKMDKWVDYFARKIKSLGEGAVKATIEAPGKVLDLFQKEKEDKPEGKTQ